MNLYGYKCKDSYPCYYEENDEDLPKAKKYNNMYEYLSIEPNEAYVIYCEKESKNDCEFYITREISNEEGKINSVILYEDDQEYTFFEHSNIRVNLQKVLPYRTIIKFYLTNIIGNCKLDFEHNSTFIPSYYLNGKVVYSINSYKEDVNEYYNIKLTTNKDTFNVCVFSFSTRDSKDNEFIIEGGEEHIIGVRYTESTVINITNNEIGNNPYFFIIDALDCTFNLKFNSKEYKSLRYQQIVIDTSDPLYEEEITGITIKPDTPDQEWKNNKYYCTFFIQGGVNTLPILLTERVRHHILLNKIKNYNFQFFLNQPGYLNIDTSCEDNFSNQNYFQKSYQSQQL